MKTSGFKYTVLEYDDMKKLIFLGVIAVVALAGIYYFFPQAFQQTADNSPKKFSSVEELNAFINASAGARMYGGGVMTGAVSEISTQKTASDISQPTSSESGAPSSGPVDYSQTNIQVAGVDEADIVKTDGKYIYAVSGNKVFIIDAYPAEGAKILSTMDFNGSVSEIFINGGRLVVFGQENYQYSILATGAATGVSDTSSAAAEKMMARPDIMPRYYSSRTFINVYDVSDKANPKLARNISVDGNYYDSRMIGDYVYVIANQPVYNYGGGPVPLPVIYSGAAAKEIPATDIYYFGMPDNSFIFTNIISLNTQNSEEPASKTFLMGYSQNMYVSQNNIYMVYQKRVSELKIYDRLIDEIILPFVPSDIQNKISEIRNSNASSYDKMQQIGNLFDEYLRTLNPEQAAAVMKTAEQKAAVLQADVAKEMEKTVIHKISIDSGKIEYKTNGEVPGQPLNQFSMDENSGYFRIATTTSGNNWGGGFGAVTTGAAVRSISEQTAAGSAETVSQISQKMAQSAAEFPIACPAVCVPLWTIRNNECIFNSCGSGCGPNNITSFSAEAECKSAMATEITDEEQRKTMPQPSVAPSEPAGPLNHLYVLDGDLKIVGKVEDLAAGERIYSVRFMGDKAYMVTFRQTDPLFVIDLSSPQNPKVLGYLKVQGVSDYLHPYDETHVIGVGRDATEEGRITGMKISLFDVSDFANPKEVSKYIIGDRGTSSDALYDHKAFLFDREKNILVIPISEYITIKEEGKPEWQWESKYWQGAYVFNLDLANGIALKEKITHENNTDNNRYSYDWNSQIRRSLFINDVLYTLSQRMIKMNSLLDLSEINKVEFPVQEIAYPYRVY